MTPTTVKTTHNGNTVRRTAAGRYEVHHATRGYAGTFTGLSAATEFAFALVVR